MKVLNDRISEGDTHLIYLALFLEICDSDHEFCRNTLFVSKFSNWPLGSYFAIYLELDYDSPLTLLKTAELQPYIVR